MLRPLVFSLLLLAAPVTAYEDPECAWAKDLAPRCCEEHALAYVIGGTEKDREWVDRRFRICMVVNGVPDQVADQFYQAARKFGGRTCRAGARGCWRFQPSNPGWLSGSGNDRLGWGLTYRRR